MVRKIAFTQQAMQDSSLIKMPTKGKKGAEIWTHARATSYSSVCEQVKSDAVWDAWRTDTQHLVFTHESEVHRI